MKFQHCPDQSVVCPVFGTTRSTFNTYFFQVSLSNDDVVNQVTMFGPGVHPCGLNLSAWRKTVLVMHSSCLAHLLRRIDHWNSFSQHLEIQVSFSSWPDPSLL